MHGLRHALLAAATASLLALPAHAQSVSGLGGENDLRITADGSLSWQRGARTYVAEGNAVAKLGGRELRADRLTAFYRERAETGGGDPAMEIYRLEADGEVTLDAPAGTVLAGRGIYEMDTGVVVFTGGSPTLKTDGGVVVTAEDRMEYWPQRGLAVARGGARVRDGDRSFRARVIQAVFAGPAGSPEARELARVEAFDQVRAATPDGEGRGGLGVYDPATQILELFGEVALGRGGTRFEGGYARLDLAGGSSELRTDAPGESGSERVRGLISRPDVSRTAGEAG